MQPRDREWLVPLTGVAFIVLGIVSFIVDRHVPFPLLAQAMYTAGQAEYSRFKFVLIKVERTD